MDKNIPTSTERQMYQLHKKGYEDIANAIKSMEIKSETEVEVKICLEVNGAVIEDIKMTEEEDLTDEQDDEEENS